MGRDGEVRRFWWELGACMNRVMLESSEERNKHTQQEAHRLRERRCEGFLMRVG
jgi:hypothetical protein